MNNFFRSKIDIEYDLLVPPLGLDFQNMTPKQAKENFDWFISKIPERMEYLRNRCATDINVPLECLDYSPESLNIVWSWFIKIARTEKTPKEEVSQMERSVGKLGEHWIIRERLTVASQFVLRDIGMYLGETYIKSYNDIYWSYFTKPKNEVIVNRPVLFGFYYVDPENKYPPTNMPFDPIGILDYEGHKIISKMQKEGDLYDVFTERLKYILSK